MSEPDHGDPAGRGVGGAYPDGVVVQVAYLVEDLRQAALEFSRLTGAGPFFVVDHVATEWMFHPYRGADGAVEAVVDQSVAMGQWGPVQVELIEYHRLEPETVRAAFTAPGMGPHHVAWIVSDLDAEIERLAAAGATPIVEGATRQVRFAFFAQPGGGVLECYQRDRPILDMYAMVRDAAAGWDGSDPVRSLR
ncbi:VOC family protein [Dietzia lutea]|uniref:VOC domain-containing protein n=1 Tax=Dietzia lutea TaxID=546160 RepID=A0A2S1R9Y9_9ACTN|nr:VOC family protein [Dietzia lutea]AWH93074.1 hypothetical protein A6035_13850 [Dietzia lutea]AWH93096.1 hypothetical protein A6035_13975 [Dietzia lutea]